MIPIAHIHTLLHGIARVTTGGTGPATCNGNGAVCYTNLPVVTAGSSELQGILQIVFGILAGLAVMMIVIAGLQFITANGDPQGIAKARSTITYALIGLAVAVMAEVIVSFVLDHF